MPSDLPPRYSVSYYLGEIVRDDTWVEREMKMLWSFLVASGLAKPSEETPRDFARTLKRVCSMLDEPPVGKPFRKLAKEVLGVADAQHKIRRHLVHEILMEPPWYDDRVVTVDRMYSFAELEDCAKSLKTVTWRIRGLHTIAPYWLPPTRAIIVDGYETEEGLRSWTRVAMATLQMNLSRFAGPRGLAQSRPGVTTTRSIRRRDTRIRRRSQPPVTDRIIVEARAGVGL
jgi:hypothetical protein